MYLMSPLFCEKGGILFKGGHYLRKYGIHKNLYKNTSKVTTDLVLIFMNKSLILGYYPKYIPKFMNFKICTFDNAHYHC